MELITCGAVSPYRAVLGGKLVALMMLSRQVMADVEQRYGDRVSIIASSMAGRPVSRPAKLALITTSSLYEAYGSSQHNRLKIETDEGALVYRQVARTESFGTVQFAPDRVHALNEVARYSDSNRREVNNLFGEGTSPKMRLILDPGWRRSGSTPTASCGTTRAGSFTASRCAPTPMTSFFE